MLLVADNLRVTHPEISRALSDRDPRPLQKLAVSAARSGAMALDISTGPLKKDPRTLAFAVEAVQEACSLPLWLDTVNPRAMEYGLQAAQGRAVINGLSLAPQRLEPMAGLAAEYQAGVVAYLLDEGGRVVPDADGRLALAARLYEELSGRGIAPEDIILDPVCPPLVWQDGLRQAQEVLTTIRMLPQVLGFSPQTVVGISNLTCSPGPLEKRRFLERTYLAMLAGAGLTHVLLDVFHAQTMAMAAGCCLLAKGGVFSWESAPDPS